MRFVATLQPRTPLRILKRDGELREAADIPEVDFPDWAGIWTFQPVPFRSLGLNIPEPEIPDIRATHAGPEAAQDFLPFLIAFRIVVRVSTYKSKLYLWRKFVWIFLTEFKSI